MAFCNSCGASLEAGARFCNKCGAAILASTPVMPAASSAPATPSGTISPATAPTAAQPGQGGGALKVVLIVVGVIVVLGILAIGSIGFIGWRIARHARVHQEGGNVKVETPFGSVESTKDPEETAKKLGVAAYPGARILQDGTATASFGGINTVSANMETTDPFDKVSAFYKSKFPNASVTTSDQQHCTIVSSEGKNMVTITIEGAADRTRIQIASVGGLSDSKSK